MNVSFISFYEVTPPFNPLEELISLRHGNGAQNERTLFAKYDEEERFVAYASCVHAYVTNFESRIRIKMLILL